MPPPRNSDDFSRGGAGSQNPFSLKASTEDPVLGIWGRIIAELGWTKEYLGTLSVMEIYWVYYNIQKKESDFFDRLGTILGTHWEEETLQQLASGSSGKQGAGALFIPLSLAINPDLLTILKKARKTKGKQAASAMAPPAPSKIKTLADYESTKLTEYASKVMRSMKGV